MLDCLQDRFPSFRLDLSAGASGAVIIRRHLRQDSVAQPERRIAERFEPKFVEKFVVHGRARDNNFRAPWSDSFDLTALGYRKPRQALGDAAHLCTRDHAALSAAP